MTKKVYAVTVDFSGTTWQQACTNTTQLEDQIQKLAAKLGEKVHMHRYKEDALGAPEILIEASDAFMDKVKSLPLFHGVQLLDAAVRPTVRRDPPQNPPPKFNGPRR